MHRWRIFLVLFALTCTAVALDVVTTYMGFQRVGPRFEQNAVALYLIKRLGWAGLVALLAITCVICVKSFKMVYWNLSLRWSLWLNVLTGAVCIFRWVVVVSDIAWLVKG